MAPVEVPRHAPSGHPSEAPEPASVPTLFHGRYEIVRQIAVGGMATVYEVIDRPTRRRRALKVMLAVLANDADLKARFELEARVTAGIESDHIVQTFDAGIDAETGAPFLVMELLRGEDFDAVLKRLGRLAPEEIVLLLTQVASALDRTHEAGIVHRDLKPKNLFVTRREDGTPVVKVLDYGIAKFVAQSTQSMQTTRNLGTPMYMSPEQIRGDGSIDHRADVYSLAHIAYALLVGVAFWSAEKQVSDNVYALLVRVAEGTPEPPSTRAKKLGVALSAGFDAWFAKATAKDPEARFVSAGESIRELAYALGVPGAKSLAGTPRDAVRSRTLRARVSLGRARWWILFSALALAVGTAVTLAGRTAKAPVDTNRTPTTDPSQESPHNAEPAASLTIASAPGPLSADTPSVAMPGAHPPPPLVHPTPRKAPRKPVPVDPSDLR